MTYWLYTENGKEGRIETVLNKGQMMWSSQRGDPILSLVCGGAGRILYICDELYLYIKYLKV